MLFIVLDMPVEFPKIIDFGLILFKPFQVPWSYRKAVLNHISSYCYFSYFADIVLVLLTATVTVSSFYDVLVWYEFKTRFWRAESNKTVANFFWSPLSCLKLVHFSFTVILNCFRHQASVSLIVKLVEFTFAQVSELINKRRHCIVWSAH